MGIDFFGSIMGAAFSLFNIVFYIYDIPLTFLDVMLWGVYVTIVLWFIWRVFSG